MFLEIPQNSQENTCARASFLIKLQAYACSFIKKETLAQVFYCEFCESFKTPFYRTLPKYCFYDERDRQKNACTQAAIRFFTVRYDSLLLYLNGHSFFEYEHKIFKVFKICFLTKNWKNLNTFSSVSFYLYLYKMKTFEISCRKVKISISVFSPRWKVRVSQKNFTSPTYNMPLSINMKSLSRKMICKKGFVAQTELTLSHGVIILLL